MKILIYMVEKRLKPIGGPFGYCFNILQKRDAIKDVEITFLHSGLYRLLALPYLGLKKIKGIVFTKLLHNNQAFLNIKNCIFESRHINKVDLSNFDIVHFHTTDDLYGAKKSLDKYNGIVLLTSHSPKVFYKEIIEDVISDDEYNKNKDLFDSSEKFDRFAFERADYIIFPCPGAEEPYYHSWAAYSEIRKESKIRYIPTGILPVECKKTRSEVRRELNIPEEGIVLSFVGRHCEVKGYDILQEIFAMFDNIYVICCGNVGSIRPPKSDRWIEIGWTNDPYSYIGASDIYMLPNRETYFDISMLQALSIGKCSIISNTGGNKEFVNTPGVKLYSSISEAVSCVKEFSNMDISERVTLENLQREEFKEKYTIDVFYDKYKEMMKELLASRS